MKMKKLLATALILLMSMMVCVPAFAAMHTETIDCINFDKNESGEGWNWNQTAKTLTITDDLLIAINRTSNSKTYYGIKLPDGATLNIQKSLLIEFRAGDLSQAGFGLAVYAEGDLTINGKLDVRRVNGGDFYAVSSNGKVTLNNAQINAAWGIGISTNNLEVQGDNNSVTSDFWALDYKGDIALTGNGSLVLTAGDTPIHCERYTVGENVTLKFNPIPVPEYSITYTIPGSLTGGVTPADGSLTVSIGEMSSDAWAAAIREALKVSSSGEISSIGLGVKVTPPDGAAKMMQVSDQDITDDQFSAMVLNSNEGDNCVDPYKFGGWEFTLANVAKEGNGDYTVTPSPKNEYIHIAWKNNEDKVIRVEKLNVVVDSTSAAPITVSKEQVAKPAEKPSSGGSGSGSSVWYRGGNSLGASIPSDPTEVLIDGVSVPFTVDGNTITIPSLTDGPHNVKVIWRGGSYSFNITASGTGKSIVALPKTGDSSMGPYVGLCMLVFMGMLAGGAVLNRKKAK